MTHEELLVRVKLYDDWAKGGYTPAVFQALRAVVELHKPIKSFGDERYMACDHCEEWSTEDALQVAYPCPTIQAIEKELK